MPPCGYRPPAINGMGQFLADNLAYFIELYRPQGLTPSQAMDREEREIAAIRAGARGGPWSASVVLANLEFYRQLRLRAPQSWDDVEREGATLIQSALAELGSLSHQPLAAE